MSSDVGGSQLDQSTFPELSLVRFEVQEANNDTDGDNKR